MNHLFELLYLFLADRAEQTLYSCVCTPAMGNRPFDKLTDFSSSLHSSLCRSVHHFPQWSMHTTFSQESLSGFLFSRIPFFKQAASTLMLRQKLKSILNLVNLRAHKYGNAYT
jgi:hypothetical protein